MIWDAHALLLCYCARYIVATEPFYLAAPADYNGANVTRTFIFPGGATIVSFPIPIFDDNVTEAVEQFDITLFTNDPFVTLGPDSAVQITESDREFEICIMYHSFNNECNIKPD